MTIAEIIALVAAFVALIGLIVTVSVQSVKMGRIAGNMETTLRHHSAMQQQTQSYMETAIKEIRNEVVEVRKIVTDVALINQQIATQRQDISALSGRVEELAHGEGFVMPLEFPRRSPSKA